MVASVTPTLPHLTSKQREVLALVADNRTSKEIAARLGISESAVNQRIELVRARLGGLPRGELARLYRLEFSLPDPSNPTILPFQRTWKKIYLPETAPPLDDAAVEGIPTTKSEGALRGRKTEGNGSQLSAQILGRAPTKASHEDRVMVFVRGILIIALMLAGLVISAGITSILSPRIAGS